MRVALSVDSLEPMPGGIGRYTLELVRGLRDTPEIAQLRFFVGHEQIVDPEARLLPQNQSAEPVERASKLARWWKRRSGAARRRDMASSVVHSTNFFLPDWAEGGVATIHDLSVLRFPNTHPQARLDDYAARFDRSLARADHFITGTEAMRRELIETLAIAPDRITAVPHGVSPPETPGDRTVSDRLATMCLTAGSYSLCVATIEPRKRIGQLLEAYALLPTSIRNRWPLVLVGKIGWLADDILSKIEEGRRAGWVNWLGFASDEMLESLYFGARCFIYPSLYEGFGLPPVEAMAHGVPVMISNDPSLVEVSGRAAMIVEADDPLAFARSIERGLTDEQWRHEAVLRGHDVAAALTWGRTVSETVDVYRRVAD